MSILSTFKAKLFKRSSKENSEPITFSGGYPPADSEEAHSGIACCENQGKNLVVATVESRFADDMIDYALEMADRMDYGIIALNAANLTPDVTDFFSTTQEELYRDFKEDASRNIKEFRERAQALELKFAHTTSPSDLDLAIRDITKECGQIEFIITENREPVITRDQVPNPDRIAQRLFVYSVD